MDYFYDIYAEILSKEGRTVTKLIYDIHITHSGLKRHLNKLLEKGLVIKRRVGSHDIYSPTEKRLLYLKHYKQIKELLHSQI
ncbi:MAG: helix-turn-helix domain-containing protein [Nitrososphaerales archaeon]